MSDAQPAEWMVVHYEYRGDLPAELKDKSEDEKNKWYDKQPKGTLRFFTRRHSTTCISCGTATPKVDKSHADGCTRPKTLDPRDLYASLDCSGVVFAPSGEQAEKAHAKFCTHKA